MQQGFSNEMPTGLGGPPFDMYGGYPPGPPPPAPGPPRSGQPTPHYASPRSSTDSLNGSYFPNVPHVPSAPPPHHVGYAPAPPAPPPPGVHGGMRGGDAGHLNRRNTTSNRPTVVHHAASDFDAYSDQYSDYPRGNRSPDDQAGMPFIVIPGTGGNARTYHPSSNYSDNSYLDSENRPAKGYITSTGGGSHRYTRPPNREVEYNIAGREQRRGQNKSSYLAGGATRPAPPSTSMSDGPPTRRERSQSRPEQQQLMTLADREDDDTYEERPPNRRVSSGPVSSNSGALVRSRSRSMSRGPQPVNTGALIPHKPAPPSSDEESPTNSNTIRLEVAGQAIDIAYSGDNGGKPIGITINTSARTISVPDASPTSAVAAPAPAPAALPPPPPPIGMVPAPPPPGQQAQIMPAPGPAPPAPSGRPRSHDSDDYPDSGDSDQGRGGDPRASLYESLAQLSLESPPTRGGGPAPILHDDRSRGRKDRSIMPPSAMAAPPRRSSRSRSRPRRREAEEPLWTKISRDIVSRRAVLVRGYEHEETSGAIIIYRVLDESEIDDLVELSDQIRSGKVEVVRRGRDGSGGGGSGGGGGGGGGGGRRPPSRPANRRRPVSIHGYPGGPGPSKERPAPRKPAIVYGERGAPPPPGSFPGDHHHHQGGAPPPPEVPEVPEDRHAPAPPPPVAVVQTKKGGGGNAGLMEDPSTPGTYIGYTRNPPRKA